MLALVVVVPQLRGNEQVLALDDALADGPTDTLARLLAVLVVPGAIDVAIPKLDGVVHCVSLFVNNISSTTFHTIY